jgi:acyl-CoA thioesterase-1
VRRGRYALCVALTRGALDMHAVVRCGAVFGAVFSIALGLAWLGELPRYLESQADQGVADRPPVLVAYGTSLTAAFDWTGMLAKAAGRCGLALQAWNAALNGVDSRWGLAMLEERVEQRRPDIVLVEFAINDALASLHISLEESAANISALVEALRRRLPRARILLMTMNPTIGMQAQSRPDLRAYYALYRQIAQERGVELVDLNQAWLRIAAADPGRLQRMIPDGAHPTLAAHLAVTVPGIAAALVGHPCPAVARVQ